ncbi:MAG: hypothetical protein H0W69_05950 [Gemmatimonadaceae bacterium]|nr:hypothetical protein [Gemmatimonadaceae bacterium]
MRAFILSALLLLAMPIDMAGAQRSDTSVALSVTLDHPDWRYRRGEMARFSVALTRNGHPVPDARVIVILGQERMKAMRRDTVSLAAGPYTIGGTLREPGFLRVTATTKIDGLTHTAMATAGFDPESMVTSRT